MEKETRTRGKNREVKLTNYQKSQNYINDNQLKRISLYMELYAKETLRQAAEDRGISMSEFILTSINEKIEREKDQYPIKTTVQKIENDEKKSEE